MIRPLRSRPPRARRPLRVVAAGLSVVAAVAVAPAGAQTSTTYDFNTPGDLAAYFESAGPGVGSVTQSTDTGIGGSGAIAVPLSSVSAVYSSKEGYSIGPVGSTYVFSTSIKSEGNSGYSGVGFTSTTPSVGTGNPYRPADALGVSVHGGGFVVHNGGDNYYGSWASGGTDITSVTTSSCSDLINNNTACGSPDKWFRFFFTIERVSTTTFDVTIEVWPSDVDGTLRFADASAKFEVNGLENDTIRTAPQIFAYFNFSGVRVTAFDDYRIDLSGGATVVASGAPVVVTDTAQASGDAIEVDGNVTFDGGTSVTQRGFVYSTDSNPTLADDSVAIGSGTGTFSGSATPATSGTYKVRTFATNATATSYGAEVEVAVTVPDGGGGGGGGGGGAGPTPAVATGPTLSCRPDAPAVGTTVTCDVAGGDADIDILWRASAPDEFASQGVRLGPDGAGTFTFAVPAGAAGRDLTVELVAWGASQVLGVPAATATDMVALPTVVRAGGGPVDGPLPLRGASVLLAVVLPAAVLALRTRRAG